MQFPWGKLNKKKKMVAATLFNYIIRQNSMAMSTTNHCDLMYLYSVYYMGV